MKKLMIAAAIAAMGGAALADAQVYEYKLDLNTTTCKAGKATKSVGWQDFFGYDKGDEVVYRTQAKMQLVGLTWGCYCDTALAGKWNDRDVTINAKGDTTKVWDGITFWNPKTDAFLGGVYNGSEFDWSEGFINRMGKKADEVELTFALVPSADAVDTDWGFTLAGFGKVKDVYNKVNDDYCSSYITSAKGGVAGYQTVEGESWTCTYCDQWGAMCEVAPFCECSSDFDVNGDMTVAYGTWTMKFNATAAKKLQKALLITKSYGFKKNSAVLAELVAAGE